MSNRKAVLAVLLLVPFLLAMSAEGESHEPASSGMLGKVINFAVLFGGLTFALYKPARNFLAKRTRDIQASLDEARDARTQAEARLEEARRRIASLEDEIAGFGRSAEIEGLAEKERIKALAEKEALRIRTFTQQEIDLQLKAGIQELKEYTADLAARLAEARMKDRITPAAQSDLIDQSIERLAELHEERRPD
jgi:F-type H+-transporting ATPase subunit b